LPKIGLGYFFGDFLQTHLVTLSLTHNESKQLLKHLGKQFSACARVFNILESFLIPAFGDGPQMMTRREFIKPEQCCQMVGIF
jgi:hypothetical protein